MPKRATDDAYYRDRFYSIAVRPKWAAQVRNAAQLILANAPLYEAAEAGSGVPRIVFALTHYRECACNPARQILNGERWDRRTVLVPRFRGPWPSWAAAAREAARDGNWAEVVTWSVPTVLRLLESHNGWGYRYRGLDSPYLWAGSQHYVAGKFVADGLFDATFIDKQVGAATLWHELIERGYSSLEAHPQPQEATTGG